MELPVINWFEEPIKESVTSVFHGLNAFIESIDLFNKFRKTHFEMLQHQVGTVKILGMQHPMDLKDLYYPAAVSTDIRRRIYAPESNTLDVKSKKKNRKHDINSTQAGDVFISKNKRVVVLGGPGAGKTTFLKFLALAYSDKNIFSKTKLTTSQLPIYLHLPLLAREGSGILESISSLLTQREGPYAIDFYTRLLLSGDCTLFLDSLDEVPQESRQSIIDKINAFSALYQKCSIVLTCRTADYEPVFENFSEIELIRLTKDAIESIIKAWFGKDHERGSKLLSLLFNDETVSSLTETPLLLSLLCIQFKNDLALPKKRTELYRRCVDALLRDWDSTRGFRRDTSYAQLSDDKKEKIFEAIAGKSCSNSIEYEFSEAFVLNALSEEISRFSIDSNEAKGILTEIESHHGILEKCSAESYEFSHGTMQEYFAARYFVAKRVEMNVLKKHYDEQEWHNIIMFMVSIMDDPSDLLNFLVLKSSMVTFQNYPAFGKRLFHLLLLYRCMATGVSISQELRTEICTHLVKSQINMLSQLNGDGVLPFAARIPNGVRQALFHYKKNRPSLIKILQPYRNLMNEIALNPVKEYAEKVTEQVEKMDPFANQKIYPALGIATCILAPISDAKPEFFFKKMIHYSEEMLRRQLGEGIRSVLVESISIHQTMYPEICKP
ncbi:NACHT domain-containing protein [Undibacterium parvum]|uniref:NACHT domain-containing protein n=1 Tax=Undibacterium parvum TaxID=401471 RepID=A0A3S9HJS5_9BURK|nr:NACHT domain-containing protein [Undibacterium parvum]AZP12369.1 NACHT domain-containing protein [Undibacterium parvum]